MDDDDLVTVPVSKGVFKRYGYDFDSENSNDEILLFVAAKDEREKVPLITFDQPDLHTSDGTPCYTVSKIVDTIASIHGWASLGEAKHIIEAVRKQL